MWFYRPTAPITLAPNDEAQVSLSVANNTKSEQNILIQLNTAPQFRLLNNAQTSITLAPMSEGSVDFKLKATDHLGSGILYFTAAYLDEQQQPAPPPARECVGAPTYLLPYI